MNIAPVLTVLASVIGIASLAAAQPAMLNTFPTSGGGQSFNPDSWRTVRGPDSTAGPQVATGHLFTAQATGAMFRIVTMLRHIDGDNTYTLQVRHGDANQIGPVIEQWSIQGSGGPFPYTGVWAAGTSVLNQGQTYWITLIGNGTAHGQWHLNTQGFHGEWSQSTNGGTTFLLVNGSQLPAIRIEPEGYPNCTADWNRDGVINGLDISAYLSTWVYSVTNGTLEADFNGCGCVNSNHISAFLTAWLAQVPPGGC